jgi:hypothetical protein
MPNIELSTVVDNSTLEVSGSTLRQKDAGTTLAKMANLAQSTIIGRAAAAGTGVPTALTPNQVSTILDSATDPFVRTSVGGGGDSTHTAAYASRPAAGNAGDAFFPSNGFYVERDTGAAWVPWGPLFPFTAPVSGDYAWINQGSASVVTTNGGIYLSTPADAGTGANLRIRKKAAPSVPYTVTMAFMPLMVSTSHTVGLCFRQSSDGKIATFGLENGATPRLVSYKYTDETNFSASYTTLDIGTRPSLWFFRIADNNTNRICSFSFDGQNFFEVHSVGRTDFLTADEVGFFIQSANTTYGDGMTVLSWKQA